MFTIEVHLTKKQYAKATKGKTFQVSADSMHKKPNTNIVMRTSAKRSQFNRNRRNEKGFRFIDNQYALMTNLQGAGLDDSDDEYESDFGDDMTGGALNFKSLVNKGVKAAKNHVAPMARDFAEHQLQVGTKKAQQLLEQSLGGKLNLKKLANRGVNAAKNHVAPMARDFAEHQLQVGTKKAQQLLEERLGGKLNLKNLANRGVKAAKNHVAPMARDFAEHQLQVGTKKAQQLLEERLGGKLNFKKIGNKIKNSKAVQSVQKQVVSKVKDVANDFKHQAIDQLKEQGSKFLTSAAVGAVNYVAPGAGEVFRGRIESGINKGINKASDRVGGSVSTRRPIGSNASPLYPKIAKNLPRGSGFRPVGSGFRPAGSGFMPAGSGLSRSQLKKIMGKGFLPS